MLLHKLSFPLKISTLPPPKKESVYFKALYCLNFWRLASYWNFLFLEKYLAKSISSYFQIALIVLTYFTSRLINCVILLSIEHSPFQHLMIYPSKICQFGHNLKRWFKKISQEFLWKFKDFRVKKGTKMRSAQCYAVEKIVFWRYRRPQRQCLFTVARPCV